MSSLIKRLRESKLRRTLASRLHRDERGAVTLETILIVAAIAVPILIFILKFGWPKIRIYFYQNLQQAEDAADNVRNNR